jgi:hypothetical protein
MSHKCAVGSTELGSRSGPASALSDLVDHEREPDPNHPGVLGQGDTLLSGTKRTVLSHAGGPQVQAEGAQGEGGQPSAGQPGWHHRQYQGRADGDLCRGQQPGEPFGIELAKERIGSRGKPWSWPAVASSAPRLDSPALRKYAPVINLGGSCQAFRRRSISNPPTGEVLASETTVAPNVPIRTLRASPRASPAWSGRSLGPCSTLHMDGTAGESGDGSTCW